MNKKEEFFQLIKQLEPVEFIGLARILCVELINKETKQNRDFFEVFEDIINKFDTVGRKQKREILKVLRKVGKENARTKD